MKFFAIFLLTVLALTVEAQELGCSTGDCDNGIGRFIFLNSDKYVGEFKNGQLNGNGHYISKNGNEYRGQFKDNMRHGYGTYRWVNGDLYIGEYKNNEREGEGTYFGTDGTVNEGFWEKGIFVKTNETADSLDFAQKVSSNAISDTVQTNDLNNFKPAITLNKLGQKRNALVIGNSAYAVNPLKNPENDAVAICEALRNSGFNVMLYSNLSQKELKIAIREFGQQLKESGGVGLFYFAGHGLQEDGRNYILPVDADIRKAEDIEFEAVDLSRVLVEMDYAENDMNLIIIDACRDNPYKEAFRDSRNRHNGLASIQTAPYNSFIAFSTSPGAVASDNSDAENGLYTAQLLEAMQKKGVKLEDVFKSVRANVRKLSNGAQIPWEISSIEADFYFRDE
jgi:hypothetical protein